MAPFPRREAEAVVTAALGKPLGEAFAEFGPAVAAASIAQVHRAEIETPDGRKPVAVKVLRPGIEQRFRVDLDAFTFAARRAEALSPEARRLRLMETVATLRRSVWIEMDLRFEAAALSEMAENTKTRSGLPRADGGLGPHRQGRADARLDRRHAAARPRQARSQGLRPQASRPRRDPDLPAPRAARRLLPRRHASGKSVRR